jgi:formylglycine-generating enzyme required for sulfatase activity
MGSPKDEKDARIYGAQNKVDFEPLLQKVVIKRGFYLGKYEVTQEQYQAVMGKNPSTSKIGSQLPVETVSWADAEKFCKLLSDNTRTIRLPREEEWEYACRAGATTPFHFGPKLNGDLANCDGRVPYPTGWKKGEYLGGTVAVGSYPANRWGLCDMHGNVAEWCSDLGRNRLFRGGSWLQPATECRAAVRFGRPVDTTLNWVGFRIAMDRNEQARGVPNKPK